MELKSTELKKHETFDLHNSCIDGDTEAKILKALPVNPLGDPADTAKSELLRLLTSIPRPGIAQLINYLLDSDFFTAPCSTEYHLNCDGGLAIHSWNTTRIFQDLCSMFDCNELHSPTYIAPESQIIIPALHDICKTNFYKPGGKSASTEQWKYLNNLWNDKQSIVFHNNPDDAKLFRDNYLIKKENGSEVRKDIPGDQASLLIDWLKNRPGQPMPKDLPKSWSVDDQFPIGHGEKSVIIILQHMKLTKTEMLAIRWHMAAFDAGIHFNYPSGFPFRKAQENPAVSMLQAADLLASNVMEVKTDGK